MDEVNEFVSSEGETAEVEAELRAALRHVPAPDGFTGRVMARVEGRANARMQRKWRFHGLHRNAGLWTSIAAALVLAVGGNLTHTRHLEQERQAAAVQAQLDLAMELTGHALDAVQGNLDRSTAGQILNGLQK